MDSGREEVAKGDREFCLKGLGGSIQVLVRRETP